MLLNPWFYRGEMGSLPKPSDWAGRASALYLLKFSDRCKVGISTNPPERLKALHCTHRQTSGAGVLTAAISAPTAHAFGIEQNLLREFGVLRIAGEYLAVDFDTLLAAATKELNQSPKSPPPTPPASAVVRTFHKLSAGDSVPVMRLMPKIRTFKDDPHPFAVEWSLHESELRVSEWQALRRSFMERRDAERFMIRMCKLWLATMLATGFTRAQIFGFKQRT